MPIIRGKFFELRQPLVKMRVSNAVPYYDGDELAAAPAVQKAFDIWALIDTGATTSVVNSKIQRELMLIQQGSKPVLFPNMTETEFHPTYTTSLQFFEHYSESSKLHEWSDWPEMLSFELSDRIFQAVIGMDILSSVRLSVNKGTPVLEF